MQSALAFVVDHWIELALGLVVLLSILNKALPGHPNLAKTARIAADLIALMPMRGAKSATLVWLAGKLGPNLAGAFVDWLSKWLNLPLSPSVPADAKPPLELLPPPRGMVLGRVLFGIIGAVVAGTFAAEGYYGAAAVFGIIFSLCLLLLTGKRSIVLALFAVGALNACGLKTKAGRDRVLDTVFACGIQVGLTELTELASVAKTVLEDGRITEGEVPRGLDQLAAAAKPGLVKCVVQLIYEATHVPDEPTAAPDPGFRAASLRVSYESKEQRKKRRAKAWLAKQR